MGMRSYAELKNHLASAVVENPGLGAPRPQQVPSEKNGWG